MLGEIIGLIGSVGTNIMLDTAIKSMTRYRAMDTLTKIGVRVGAITVSSVIGKVIRDDVDDKLEEIERAKEKARLQQLAKERA